MNGKDDADYGDCLGWCSSRRDDEWTNGYMHRMELVGAKKNERIAYSKKRRMREYLQQREQGEI